MALFVHPYVIADLAGVTYRQVRNDVARFNWQKKTRSPSLLKFLNLSQAMTSYGRSWSKENIELAIARHTKPAAFETEE